MKPSADLEKGAVGASSIQRHFGTLPDPRVQRGQAHLLLDVVTIAILAVIAGAKGWDDMEVYAKAHEPWLRGFLELPGGPPSDDTFRRIFVRLNAKAFRNCFMAWMSALAGSVAGMLIAIDGKTLRRSFDCASGRTALHLVHAWAAENRVLLGQVATAEKSNEITAIPELLDLLELKGAIVTIDAMGCQRKIVEKIVEKGADYAIALKGNQEKLHDEVAGYLDAAIADGGARMFETRDEGHGRVEARRLYAVSNVAWLSATHGRGCEAWCASSVNAPRTGRRASSASTTSRAFLRITFGASPGSSAATGASRTRCTGASMSPSTRTRAGSGLAMDLKTSRSFGASRSSCSDASPRCARALQRSSFALPPIRATRCGSCSQVSLRNQTRERELALVTTPLPRNPNARPPPPPISVPAA